MSIRETTEAIKAAMRQSEELLAEDRFAQAADVLQAVIYLVPTSSPPLYPRTGMVIEKATPSEGDPGPMARGHPVC
jgi:hypothetical protein